MNRQRLVRSLMVLGLLALHATSVPAQWLTQSFELKAGWNAIFLHVDAAYATLDELVGADGGNPIQEIWLWNPVMSTAQFVQSPQIPSDTGSQWVSWVRAQGASSGLQRLGGNVACLVRVDLGVASYTWNVKGKALPPFYSWTTTGLNFLGFPTVPVNPPSFEDFLAKAPQLQQNAQIFYYLGGELGPGNPARLYALRTTPVRRGEALWIRAGDYFNRYFGPFELVLQNTSGIKFMDSLSQYQFRLRNLTATPITVTAQLAASESDPSGPPSPPPLPPLLLRGELNTTDLTYGYTSLNNGPQQWTLQPYGQLGSEVEVVLGLNRSQMADSTGDLFAGILRFTDSLNFCQMDIPVSANVTSTDGLWVGGASVNQVRHYLTSYAQNADGQLTLSANGAYIPVSTNTTLGSVARPFPLRLILHQNAAGQVVLLQRVYCGVGLETNPVVANRESLLLKSELASARRISATHLPWSTANNPWACAGELKQGSILTTTVDLAYDDPASNPFLHSYHPDHDNLNATFDQARPQGEESYGISRQITLALTAPADDFASVTSGTQSFVGTYDETIILKGKSRSQGINSRQFSVRGAFILNRISDIATLTMP